MANKKIILSGGGGSGLVLTAIDGIRGYLMEINPILAHVIFFISLIIFLIGIFQWLSDYLNIKKKTPQWKIVSLYILPIIILSFSFSTIIPKFNQKRITSGDNLKAVYNRNFKNETVVLDGSRFVNCSFEGVTFVWNGDNFAMESGTKVLSYQKFTINEPIARKVVELALRLYCPESKINLLYFNVKEKE